MAENNDKDWVLEGLRMLGAGAVAPVMAAVAAATGDDEGFEEHAFRAIVPGAGDVDDLIDND